MTTTTMPPNLADHTDRLAIQELTSAMLLHLDAREWDRVLDLFADSVRVDYTSLNGGEPQTVTSAALIGGWRQPLDHLDATQHLLGNQVVQVDGDQARCSAHVQGTHVLANASGGPVWTVGGRYEFGLVRTRDGWKIDAITLIVLWATGNRYIMQLAAAAGA
jgi:hypothetical protein